MKRFFLAAFFVLVFGFLGEVGAANYYVDFDAGKDSNDGLSRTTAWKNIPGTRNTGNTGYVTGNSGWVKLNPGDTILIRSGTVHDSYDGGRILIDENFFNNGTSASPIIIKRDESWGSGQVVIDGTGITIKTFRALVDIKDRAFIKVDGSVDNGILIRDSSYYGIMIYGKGESGCEIRNLEVYNSSKGNVLVECSDRATPNYISNIILDKLNVHKTNFNDDWGSNINVVFGDNVIVSNSSAYDANLGADGIHFGSCRNSWILNCEAYNNGEHGVDISRDGDYKSRDDSYNNTIRNVKAYENYKSNLDANSGSRDIYFINSVSWKTTINEVGDGNNNIHEGAQGSTFWINLTTSKGKDWGYGYGWSGNPWNIPGGTYHQYIINSISSEDTGASVHVAYDTGSVSYALNYYNSDFNSVRVSSTTYAVDDKGTRYTKENINNGTGGWPGQNCIAKDPLFVANGETWQSTNLNLQDSSPCINSGTYPFTTSFSGSGTVVTLKKLIAGLDARQVFRPGDLIRIEDSGEYEILSVESSSQIKLKSSATWSSGKGIWFPWSGLRPDMGAYEYQGSADTIPPAAPTGLTIVN